MQLAFIKDIIFFEKCLSYQYYSVNEFLPVEEKKKNGLLNLKCFSSERHSNIFNMSHSLKKHTCIVALSGNIWTSGNMTLLSKKHL